MTSKSVKSIAKSKECPDIVIDSNAGHVYQKGALLGKGGFAKCYEFTRVDTNEVLAGKVVPNELLKTDSQKEKMVQEVQIQRSLNHENIVKIITSFHDNENVYVLLELCRRRSLMELHRRRVNLLEPEVRYYTRQILQGCTYLHRLHVIHRDLKLGNVFLNDTMQIKIGDFGLATTLTDGEEKKKTLCGTPNYIAPEILNKTGHSYEVDVWSVGCIVFTLLVGKPPFETDNLKETYRRIRKCSYQMPHTLTLFAKQFIGRILVLEPQQRPSMEQLLQDNWLVKAFVPTCLPTSSLSTAPRFDFHSDQEMSVARDIGVQPSNRLYFNPSTNQGKEEGLLGLADKMIVAGGLVNNPGGVSTDPAMERISLASLYQQLKFTVTSTTKSTPINGMEESEHPASGPIFWVAKWVDYSDKYGLGYQLCDNSTGVLFNDFTRLLQSSDGAMMQFIDREGHENHFSSENVPDDLQKKMRLMSSFRSYMEEYLVKAGENQQRRELDDMIRLPYMKSWMRTSTAISMHLSNGTLQINFFSDHTKLILCPLMSAVTYIDADRVFRTYLLDLLRTNGIAGELLEKLQVALTNIRKLMEPTSSGFSSTAALSSIADGQKLANQNPAQPQPLSTKNILPAANPSTNQNRLGLTNRPVGDAAQSARYVKSSSAGLGRPN